jgi:hypothetical protein
MKKYNELKKLLIDAKDNLEWIMNREEWLSLQEGSSADITVKEIKKLLYERNTMNDTYSVRDLARHFEVGENYIFILVRDGKLIPVETNPIKVSKSEVKRYWENRIPTNLFNLEFKKQKE